MNMIEQKAHLVSRVLAPWESEEEEDQIKVAKISDGLVYFLAQMHFLNWTWKGNWIYNTLKVQSP